MNLIKREWASYRKQTLYWLIGLILLIIVAFYKVDGMASVPGGLEGMLSALPPVLQTLFGAGIADYNSGVGMYGMIHLYLVIALLLHATMLGSTIFSKEESDKTFEFLYIKGMKRSHILIDKIGAGISLLAFVNIICFLTTIITLLVMGKDTTILDFLPYIGSLYIFQCVCFAFTLSLSLIFRNNRKVGSYGSGLIMIMFMLSMYVKMGGNIGFIEDISIFYYLDATYIQSNGFNVMSNTIFVGITIILLSLAYHFHERRDLL